jgi:hypothetical protein
MPQEFPFPPPQGQSLVVGNATPAEVLAGATFSSQAAGIGAVGTMPNRGSPTLQPGQTIPPGYYAGGQVAPGGILLDVAAPSIAYLEVIEVVVATGIPLTVVEPGTVTDQAARTTDTGSTDPVTVADVASGQQAVTEPFPITDSAAQA